MKNHQTSVNPNPILHFYYKIVSIRTFLTFVDYPNFSIIPNHVALVVTNTMTCAMKHEAWTWYLSHLLLEKSF